MVHAVPLGSAVDPRAVSKSSADFGAASTRALLMFNLTFWITLIDAGLTVGPETLRALRGDMDVMRRELERGLS